jgi:hypothetical protein
MIATRTTWMAIRKLWRHSSIQKLLRIADEVDERAMASGVSVGMLGSDDKSSPGSLIWMGVAQVTGESMPHLIPHALESGSC